MLSRFVAFWLCLAVWVTLTPTAIAQDRVVHTLKLRLIDGERVVGTPEISLFEGAPAILTLERDGGYSLKIAAESASDEMVTVDAEIYLKKTGKWVPAARPRMQVSDGEPAVFETYRRSSNPDERAAFRLEILSTRSIEVAENAKLPACVVDDAKSQSWLDMMANLVDKMPGQGGLMTVQNCCPTGCLKCCGGRACCSDPWNCPSGCCT